MPTDHQKELAGLRADTIQADRNAEKHASTAADLMREADAHKACAATYRREAEDLRAAAAALRLVLAQKGEAA